jgi:hypothetical protein
MEPQYAGQVRPERHRERPETAHRPVEADGAERADLRLHAAREERVRRDSESERRDDM